MAGGHGTGAVPESSHLFHTQQAGRAHSSPGTQLLILPKQLHLLGSLPSKGVTVGVSSFQTTTECVKEKNPRPNPEMVQDSGRREEDAES